MSLLGIDIGSSSCKGVIFSISGIELASESQSYSTVNIGPSMVEIDATIFRDAAFKVVRLLSERVKNDPVEAIAISSHGETTIPVDKNGNTTGPAIMNSDNRAVKEAEWWYKTFGREQIYKITGVPLHAMFTLNKILWIRKNKPEIYAKTDKFLSVGDYILTQLGLPPYTDYSLASRTMAFDIHNHCWSEKILNHCDISKEKFGIPAPSGSLVGRLSKEIASQLGLKEGTVVALGGHDQPCGALGAGVIASGDTSDSAGTYECLVSASDKPCNTIQAYKYNLNSYCHVVPNKYVTLAFFPAGFVINWFINQFCENDKMNAEKVNNNVFDFLNKKIESITEPTGILVTPHLVGSCNPHWDANATGSIIGLTSSSDKYHLYKAIFEGLACELAENISVLEEITGKIKNVRIFGGNTRSEFTLKLRADIANKSFQLLSHPEAVCQGAAMLAGIAAGIYKNAEDAVKQTLQLKNAISPDKEMRLKYKKQLDKYKLIYSSLEKIRKI